MPEQKNYDAIIVGGGHNGLVCAFYLAKAGLKTCVVERSKIVGGAAITEEFHPGFSNSVAAYTVSLLQPEIISDMDLNTHGLEIILRKIDNYLPLENGYMLAGRNGLTAREIARHSTKDAQNLPKYEAALEKIVECVRQLLLVTPPNAGGGIADLLALLKTAGILNKLPLDAQRNMLAFFTRSASEILDQYFENETVKALFGFDAIVGHFASPEEPGSAYVLLHHVFGETNNVKGAWGHAIGGMGAITQSMAKACLQTGVEIFTNNPVLKITSDKGRQKQVHTDTAIFCAPVIAASVHPKILYEDLLKDQNLPPDFIRSIRNYKSHSGTFRMNVALDKLPEFTNAPQNQAYLGGGIIIAPTLNYMHEAWASARNKGWSDDPIVEMLIPSFVDSTLAPKGQHVASLFCQQFSYTLPAGKNWPDQRQKAADHIIATVEKHAPGFAASILGMQVLSPWDLEQKLALIGGDIFHGRMSLDQLFSAR
ncbi:MAG: NAD(P)/FAD-dependent oxidoreductase, partial [Devosiaceae bacterium]|nr:NAD(P)/FAD-dependent oxidoreductase [Devosiaceae bacterium]